MEIASLRQDYQKFQLLEKDLPESPFSLFATWFEEARKEEVQEANGMVLSTVDHNGWPNARVVLLKGVDHGFVFYTNYLSHKGQDLAHNPVAALTFWWPKAERQVRIRGEVEKTSAQESDEYFASRPEASRAGAIASHQSQVLTTREELENRYQHLLDGGKPFKRPEHWGGYRVLPTYMEFWQGRQSRMHDRLFYQKVASGWKTGRLSP